MSWNVGNIVSVQLNQLWLGKTVVNKLWYQINSTEIDLNVSEVFLTLAEDIVNTMVLVQGISLTHVSQDWLDETDGLGSVITFHTVPGNVDLDQDLPTSNAFGGTKSVGSRLTRPGSIRIGGAQEVSVVGNTIEPGTLGILETIGANLAVQRAIQDSSARTMILDPVVVGRMPITGAVDLSRVQDVLSVGNWRITTQVSRRQ